MRRTTFLAVLLFGYFIPFNQAQAPAASLDTVALCHPMSYVEAIRDAAPKQGLVLLDADTNADAPAPRHGERSHAREQGAGRSVMAPLAADPQPLELAVVVKWLPCELW